MTWSLTGCSCFNVDGKWTTSPSLWRRTDLAVSVEQDGDHLVAGAPSGLTLPQQVRGRTVGNTCIGGPHLQGHNTAAVLGAARHTENSPGSETH